jgi:proline dehydrogenase
MAGIERNLSIKLTQLGVNIDRATCVDNLRRILEPAQRHEFFVRLDMENTHTPR